MSYVLDALKKAQSQRQQDATQHPALAALNDNSQSGDEQQTNTPREEVVVARLPFGLVLLVVAVLVLLVGFTWWMNSPSDVQNSAALGDSVAVDEPVESSVTAPAPIPQAASTNVPPSIPTAPAAVSAESVAVEYDAELAARADTAPAAKPVKGVIGAIALAEPVSSRPSQPPRAEAVGEETVGEKAVVSDTGSSTTAETAPETETTTAKIETRRLPPYSSLQKIPTVIITGHLYASDPASRSVTMNGREWFEGEPVNRDVTLEEITRDGIVLAVDGYHLNVSRRRGWQAIE